MNSMQVSRAEEHRAPSPARRPTPLEIILEGRRAAACLEESYPPAGGVPGAEAEQLEFLCVRVSRESYAIDIMAIREVIRPRRVTEIPWTSSPVRGVISLRGTMVPVLAMVQRLELEPLPLAGRERVVVVRNAFGLVGLQVDQVGQVGRVPRSAIQPPSLHPGSVGRSFVSGVVRQGRQGIILLDVERVADLGGCVLNQGQI